jgi:hypothetical protein
MTEKENKLIEDLFKQAAQQQIEDNGFTERVMEAIGNGQLTARPEGALATERDARMDNGQLAAAVEGMGKRARTCWGCWRKLMRRSSSSVTVKTEDR